VRGRGDPERARLEPVEELAGSTRVDHVGGEDAGPLTEAVARDVVGPDTHLAEHVVEEPPEREDLAPLAFDRGRPLGEDRGLTPASRSADGVCHGSASDSRRNRVSPTSGWGSSAPSVGGSTPWCTASTVLISPAAPAAGMA